MLVWVVVLWWGEERVFAGAVGGCGWGGWEKWVSLFLVVMFGGTGEGTGRGKGVRECGGRKGSIGKG